MLSFGMIQCRIWESSSIRGLSDQGKLAFGYLLANKHANMLGYYRLPIPYMAADLEWLPEKVEGAIAELETRGIIAYDQAARVVFIVNYFKWHRLSSGACEKGAIDELRQTPHSNLIVRLFASVRENAQGLRHLLHGIQEMSHSDTLFGMEACDDATPEDSPRCPQGVPDESFEKSGPGTYEYKSRSSGVVVRGVGGVGEGGGPRSVDDPLTVAERIENEAVELLNSLTGRTGAARFREGHGIKARVQEGATRDDILLVVRHKVGEWLNDPQMGKYLRPLTIFGIEKFPGYLGEAREWDRKGRPALDPKESAARGTTAWLNGEAGGPPQEG